MSSRADSIISAYAFVLLLTSVRKQTSLVKRVVFFRRLSACEKTPHVSPTSTEGARKKENA